MRSLKLTTFLLTALLCSISGAGRSDRDRGRTVVCIIGTEHSPTRYINADTLFAALEMVRPQAVLCELEPQFFTADNKFDLDTWPDLLSTNENIAAHRYQAACGIPLLPYEIEGRNEFYRQTRYFETFEEMYSEFDEAYRNGLLSEKSSAEWDIFLRSVRMFDVFGEPLRLINSPLYVQYSEAKNTITYQTFLSIARRDFPRWTETATEHLAFWDRRNRRMAENILTHSRQFPECAVVVFCGQQHKAPLVAILAGNRAVELKEYWEFNDQ